MSILPRLASAQNRRDETPNQELAGELAQTGHQPAIAELIEILGHKDKNLQSDAIKVLYEIAGRNPALLAGHLPVFLDLLQSKNNRLVWGALSVLAGITQVNPGGIHESLPLIMDAAKKGSVIAKDQAVTMLVKLAAVPEFAANALILLLELMQDCPTNQLPMYAENAQPVMQGTLKPEFAALLTKRMPEIEKESKRKRVAKVLKKLT